MKRYQKVVNCLFATLLMLTIGNPFALGVAHAGGPVPEPTVEWYNPSSAHYGGWEISGSVFFNNPTSETVRLSASIWINGMAVARDPYNGRPMANMGPRSWEYLHTTESYQCDPSGCKLVLAGNIPPYTRAYAIAFAQTGSTLGTFTLGSVTVSFDGYGTFYKEGRITLTEGPGFSATLELDDNQATGGYKSLRLTATDSHLNEFELMGVGTDCPDAVILPGIGSSLLTKGVTLAQFWVFVYVPDGRVCAATVLLRTRQTTLAVSYTVR